MEVSKGVVKSSTSHKKEDVTSDCMTPNFSNTFFKLYQTTPIIEGNEKIS